MITILDLAIFRGAKTDDHDSYSGDELARVGLPIMAGCVKCHASLAAYNAYPTTTGYTMCHECAEASETGYATVEEANKDIFGE